MNTIQKYKNTLDTATRARAVIAKAAADFITFSTTEKKEFADGNITEKALNERIAKLAAERDAKIEAAQASILSEAADFEAEMKSAAKLDGSKIDSDTLRILDSGLPLTLADWQELGEAHKDNWIMCRVLQSRYDKDPVMQDKGNGLLGSEGKEKVQLKFGTDPAKRAETFSKFANLISHTAVTGTVLPEFKTQRDYWNDLARKSLRDIKPTGDDDFSKIDETFPVETQTVQPQVW